MFLAFFRLSGYLPPHFDVYPLLYYVFNHRPITYWFIYDYCFNQGTVPISPLIHCQDSMSIFTSIPKERVTDRF